MRCVPQRLGYFFLLCGVLAERKRYKKHTDPQVGLIGCCRPDLRSCLVPVESPTGTNITHGTINQLKHGRARAVLRYNGTRRCGRDSQYSTRRSSYHYNAYSTFRVLTIILDECNAFLASGSDPTAYIADV